MAFGTTEILVIVGVIALMFGAPALVKWAKALRQAKDEFNKPPENEKK
ncbi:MAG: twin-arginine translocase TatA/TatE family subunit [Pseudomonadota bacterium]|nr:twin-arginine translocase TatA/TatE family subunit [Pseudomonadota bacterium]